MISHIVVKDKGKQNSNLIPIWSHVGERCLYGTRVHIFQLDFKINLIIKEKCVQNFNWEKLINYAYHFTRIGIELIIFLQDTTGTGNKMVI